MPVSWGHPRSIDVCSAQCRSRSECWLPLSSQRPAAHLNGLPSSTIWRSLRATSTIASVTNVHVPRSVPARFRNLDHSLSNLERDAAVYTDPSQLRLARRGLEAENAVSRVAGKLRKICQFLYAG